LLIHPDLFAQTDFRLFCQHYGLLSCTESPHLQSNVQQFFSKNPDSNTITPLALQPREVVAGVVDGHVDATGFGNDGIHGPLDSGVNGHVQFKDVYWQRILFRKHADFGGILGVAAFGIAHRRKNVCPFRARVSANNLPKPVLEPVMRTTCLEFIVISLC